MMRWPWSRTVAPTPERPRWTCARCGNPETFTGIFDVRMSKDDPTTCDGCVDRARERRRAEQKRKAELAALVAGGLSPGYRDIPPRLRAEQAWAVAEELYRMEKGK